MKVILAPYLELPRFHPQQKFGAREYRRRISGYDNQKVNRMSQYGCGNCFVAVGNHFNHKEWKRFKYFEVFVFAGRLEFTRQEFFFQAMQ